MNEVKLHILYIKKQQLKKQTICSKRKYSYLQKQQCNLMVTNIVYSTLRVLKGTGDFDGRLILLLFRTDHGSYPTYIKS